jgi:quinoprotein glucose dehydrogenase
MRLILLLISAFCSAALAEDWLYYGGNQGGAHHSELRQINRANVASLELAWSYRTGAIARHPEQRASASFHATPILLPTSAGQSLVFCTPFNRIIALDPVSGAERWTYDPELLLGPPGSRYNCRGIAYWQDTATPDSESCAQRLFMGTFDLRLIAIDARNGRACEEFGTDGQVDIKTMLMAEVQAKAAAIGRPANYRDGNVQFSSPPAVIGDIVVLGSSNNTKFNRIDGPSGMVRAFDARSGTLQWTFDPVPRNPGDPQADNWTTEALQITGAANVWSMMSVDEERDLLFLPTASASPDFFGGTRPGDNRYANSVVALRGASGEIVWHYQIVHHDVWDLDLPAQPILIDIERGGRRIPVVVQLTKQGMIFVLHRETGEPVFAVEERPVPQDWHQRSPTRLNCHCWCRMNFPLQTPGASLFSIAASVETGCSEVVWIIITRHPVAQARRYSRACPSTTGAAALTVPHVICSSCQSIMRWSCGAWSRTRKLS